jgi:serine/threonine protein kinase
LEDLLLKMLELDVTKRIKVDDAIAHPFFDSVRKDHYPIKKEYKRKAH